MPGQQEASAQVGRHVLIGRQTHPGPESDDLLEGQFVLVVHGQPPKPLKAGESYRIPSAPLATLKAPQAAPRVWQCTSDAKVSRWRLRQSGAASLRYGRRDIHAAPMVWRHIDDQLTQNRFTYPSTN